MTSAGTTAAVVDWARATCAMKIVTGHGKPLCMALQSDYLVDLNLNCSSSELMPAVGYSSCS